MHPLSQTNQPGSNVVLLAGPTSSVPLIWEWYKAGDGLFIPNATNALFIPADSGTPDVAGQ
ncbi:MAG: hypothetical protein EXS33_08740 [Pedosphaera sp.]|nr:hypothetical protein [Pedosphaera sp.]